MAKAKDGAMDMRYKPEHIVDMESGIIWQAEVRLADEADVEELTPRAVAVAELIQAISEEPSVGPEQPGQPLVGPVKTLTGDKGFFGVEVLLALQKYGIKTIRRILTRPECSTLVLGCREYLVCSTGC